VREAARSVEGGRLRPARSLGRGRAQAPPACFCGLTRSVRGVRDTAGRRPFPTRRTRRVRGVRSPPYSRCLFARLWCPTCRTSGRSRPAEDSTSTPTFDLDARPGRGVGSPSTEAARGRRGSDGSRGAHESRHRHSRMLGGRVEWGWKLRPSPSRCLPSRRRGRKRLSLVRRRGEYSFNDPPRESDLTLAPRGGSRRGAPAVPALTPLAGIL
jgi:hypothetical protein